MQNENSTLAESKSETKPQAVGASLTVQKPSSRLLAGLAIGAVLLVVAGFALGYLPRSRVQAEVVGDAAARAQAVPAVTVAIAKRAALESEIRLPATVQAGTEAPILARADGYLKRRYVDIGDRVRAGQVLAEIDAPELDQQVAQAEAVVAQASAAVEQAKAARDQGAANERLAKVTAERWAKLLSKGAVSRQENDVYQAQYQAQMAGTQALDRARLAGESSLAAAKANYERLTQMRSYRQVRAPFSGVITMRNVDEGALISAGQTLLYRVAQGGAVRAYVNVPQTFAGAVQPGQAARLQFAELPGQSFTGTIVRASDALDAASRTLLTEIHVPNPNGLLHAGMYAQVSLTVRYSTAPILVPGEALVTAGDGTQVGTVDSTSRIHFRNVTIGRDYGKTVEVLEGLNDGDKVVLNPGDAVREGTRVELRIAPGAGRKSE
jgi:RND family efflux transporter MFP subunit